MGTQSQLWSRKEFGDEPGLGPGWLACVSSQPLVTRNAKQPHTAIYRDVCFYSLPRKEAIAEMLHLAFFCCCVWCFPTSPTPSTTKKTVHYRWTTAIELLATCRLFEALGMESKATWKQKVLNRYFRFPFFLDFSHVKPRKLQSLCRLLGALNFDSPVLMFKRSLFGLLFG